MVGYILEVTAHQRQEAARLAYLRYPAPTLPDRDRVDRVQDEPGSGARATNA